MSSDLRTTIQLEGTLKEIKSMLAVIKDYCGPNHDASLDFAEISLKKGDAGIRFDDLSQKELASFLKDYKKKIYITAQGPYGKYGTVDEAGLFEAIAVAAPTAKFKAETSGSTTGQEECLVGELKKGKLHLIYKSLPDELKKDDYEEDEEDWYIEKNVYDPKEKKYVNKKDPELFVCTMIKKMPLEDFKNLFELSGVEISDQKYYEYIFECYGSYQFPKLDYIDFKFAFPESNIEETEFNEKVALAINKYGLISFRDFCEN